VIAGRWLDARFVITRFAPVEHAGPWRGGVEHVDGDRAAGRRPHIRRQLFD
jgi:hypothetical protein